ncbi:Uncharacterised protein [uncultured archaeon]|nr:Uncharacterised protein [uncultured archaeon]
MSIKISQLPAASSVSEDAVFPIVQDFITEKATISQLADIVSGNEILVVAVSSTQPGPFTVIHNLGTVPKTAFIQMTTGGQIWLNTANVALGYDETYAYCIASDANVAGQLTVVG